MEIKIRIIVTAVFCLFLGALLYQYAEGLDISFSAIVFIGLLLLQIFYELNDINQYLENKKKEESDGKD